ncbi:hypothetical protein ACMA1I_13445 [Pontibacter sp. 13R65]|uniref:hypothetical protein n=1 Tax=Pontibacter sp. 13R65 TaxID=3127458 RepID=UPI00301BF40A
MKQLFPGWNAKITTKHKIFGGVLDNLLKRTGEMILVAKFMQPLSTTKSIKVIVPPRAEYEPGFAHWVNTVRTISKQTSAPLTFFATSFTNKRIERVFVDTKVSVSAKYEIFEDWQDFLILGRYILPDDLLLVVSAREGSVSYNSYLPNIPKQLSRYFKENNFVIIYPEQHGIRLAQDPRTSAVPAY